jgi:hypothetical protein
MSSARASSRCYRSSVEITQHWMADLAGTLGATFGDRLALVRAGEAVGWTYGGAIVTVSLEPDGTIAASFGDVPTADAVAGADVRALYRPASGATYALSREGCVRMVDDLAAFFTGNREPRFAFVGVTGA